MGGWSAFQNNNKKQQAQDKTREDKQNTTTTIRSRLSFFACVRHTGACHGLRRRRWRRFRCRRYEHARAGGGFRIGRHSSAAGIGPAAIRCAEVLECSTGFWHSRARTGEWRALQGISAKWRCAGVESGTRINYSAAPAERWQLAADGIRSRIAAAARHGIPPSQWRDVSVYRRVEQREPFF